jgi:methyltransferase (TIGR00027 family)
MKEGKPSQTAMLVAFRRLAASQDPELRPLLAEPDEPCTGWFLEGHSPEVREQVERLRSGADHAFLRLMKHTAGQGGPMFILVRKRFIEDEVRSALAQGAEQVVVFGAGYDVLCLRLAPSMPQVRFFELDYPATLAVKSAALEAHAARPAGLTLLPVDFGRESAEEKLRALPGYRPEARTVFVAEAVLLYLEPADVDALLASIHRLGGPGSRFIFSLLAPQADAPAGAQKAMQGLAQIGEPVRSTLDPKELPAFLQERGFPRWTTADHEALRARYLAPLGLQGRPLDEASYFAVAEKA